MRKLTPKIKALLWLTVIVGLAFTLLILGDQFEWLDSLTRKAISLLILVIGTAVGLRYLFKHG